MISQLPVTERAFVTAAVHIIWLTATTTWPSHFLNHSVQLPPTSKHGIVTTCERVGWEKDATKVVEGTATKGDD